MEELESKHAAEVNKLQKQTDALDNQIIRLQLAAAKRWKIIAVRQIEI